jgi:predicted ATPase
MCHAAFHLNSGGEYTRARERYDKLARINLEAAKRSRARSIFENAAAFLRQGLRFLDEEGQDAKWTRHFDLALEMTEALARLELIVGNLAVCRQLNQEVFRRCTNAETKINALVTEVDANMAGNEGEQVTISSTRALQELGIVLPRHSTKLKLILKLLKVRRLIARKEDADILSLPFMHDGKSAMATKLLASFCMHNFLRENILLGLYAALMATELTMRDGLSPYSAHAFAVYGIVEITLGHLDRGIRFGELALSLTRRIPCMDSECLTVIIDLTAILHWKMSLREIDPIMVEAMNSGFALGNVVDSSLCVGNICFTRYVYGENLGVLEEFVRKNHIRLSKLGKGVMHRYAQPFMQFVVNMRSSSLDGKDLTVLTGDIMDENAYMRKAIATKTRIRMMAVWSCKSLLAFHLGCFELAASLYKRMESISERYRYGMGGPNFYFYGAMIFSERYRATRNYRHLRLVRKYRNDLKRFEALGSPNVSEFLIFLQAEELSLKCKDVGQIIGAYTTAMDAAEKGRYTHLEAMANERLSTVLSLLGCDEISDTHMTRALTLYKDAWGARAKYEWLLERRTSSRLALSVHPIRKGTTKPLPEIQF